MKLSIYFSPFFVVCLFAAVLLAGCSSTDDEMRVFVGQQSSELLSRMGPPKLRAPGAGGGQVWTYFDEGHAIQSAPAYTGSPTGFGGPAAQGSPMNTPGFTAKREFLIDASGTITGYRSKGH